MCFVLVECDSSLSERRPQEFLNSATLDFSNLRTKANSDIGHEHTEADTYARDKGSSSDELRIHRTGLLGRPVVTEGDIHFRRHPKPMDRSRPRLHPVTDSTSSSR
ncbi:MAG: hypothetical protein FRX48_01803 [Lasallia pustulata]|uniref:Uncharacterized protein n=1 Tax=Lasallia pustulata TaxID=136370 RepID=A0A5M8Q143_9LECA|nr:MAG: hypothetical protein FRX48_01803 [Lasallia pustulata]